MLSVTKWLILRQPATAERDYCSSGQPELLSFRIMNRKLALDPDRTVVIDRDLGCHY